MKKKFDTLIQFVTHLERLIFKIIALLGTIDILIYVILNIIHID